MFSLRLVCLNMMVGVSLRDDLTHAYGSGVLQEVYQRLEVRPLS